MKLSLPGSLPSGRVTLGIRCEHLHETPAGPIAGRVVTDEYFGNCRNLHVDTPAGRLIVRADLAGAYARGSELRLGFDPAHVVVFDAATEARL